MGYPCVKAGDNVGRSVPQWFRGKSTPNCKDFAHIFGTIRGLSTAFKVLVDEDINTGTHLYEHQIPPNMLPD